MDQKLATNRIKQIFPDKLNPMLEQIIDKDNLILSTNLNKVGKWFSETQIKQSNRYFELVFRKNKKIITLSKSEQKELGQKTITKTFIKAYLVSSLDALLILGEFRPDPVKRRIFTFKLNEGVVLSDILMMELMRKY